MCFKELKGPPGPGIMLESNYDMLLRAYCDAYWAGCPLTRKSVTGSYVQHGLSPICWRSKKQPTVSSSSVEAKYRTMVMTTSEVIWLRRFLNELFVPQKEATSLFCGNKAALHIANNPVFLERTKHIEVDCHFIREKLVSGELLPRYLPSHIQLADLFTKGLSKHQFQFLIRELGLSNLHALT